MNKKTNFDKYLDEQLRDPDFSRRFKNSGKAWDVAIQLSSLREKNGLSQKDLAELVGTSQQQISRLESPSYEGHSLSMLRRVAAELNSTVEVRIIPDKPALQAVAEETPIYIGGETKSRLKKSACTGAVKKKDKWKNAGQ